MASPTGRAGVTPPFPVAPHLQHPSEPVSAWFTEPAGAVMQIAHEMPGTVETVRWLGGPVRDELFRRFPEPQKVILVQDWRLMLGRDLAARPLFIQLATEMKSRISRSVLILPVHASSLHSMSLRVGMAVLAAIGVHVDIEESLTQVVGSLGLRPAPPSSA